MIFKISRTSDSLFEDKPPCKNAIKRPFAVWHTRACTEEEYNKKFSDKEGLWRSKGKNHTINERGFITRQEEDSMCWSIEVNSLDELKDFIQEEHTIIIGKEEQKNSFWIEIYDDYRE